MFACLDALTAKNSSDSKDTFETEIIVTDDEQSIWLSRKLSSRYGDQVRWVAGPGQGPAANRNNGATESAGEWLIFLDDDCIPDSNLIRAYYPHMTNSQILEGSIEADRDKQRYDEESPINIIGGQLWSCNFAISRLAFDHLGGFEKAYCYAALEDVDFRLRALSKGYEIPFIRSAAVVHPWRRVYGYRMLKNRLKSHAILWRKIPEVKPKSPALYFLYPACRDLIKSVLPNLYRYRCRGLGFALLQFGYTLCWTLMDATKRLCLNKQNTSI